MKRKMSRLEKLVALIAVADYNPAPIIRDKVYKNGLSSYWHFSKQNRSKLDKIARWKHTYRAPGTVIEITIQDYRKMLIIAEEMNRKYHPEDYAK